MHSLAMRIGTLLMFLVAAFSAAAFGAQFHPGEWYAGLNKPSWTPPNSWFGPVWTMLYLGIAIAGWLVWQRGGWKQRQGALTIYAVQLVLNALWSWLFFGRHQIGLALGEIILLWIAILATMLQFFRVHRAAGFLFVPYLLWVSFATALNAALWRLNS